MNPNGQMKKTPLRMFSFFFMIVAFIVMGLAYSYVFRIDILSRIIPSVPKPQPIPSYSQFGILMDVVLPISYLIGSSCFILISLRDVFAEKRHYGIRPEIALIAVSLLVMGFTMQLLAGRIQPASSINDTLELIGLILGLSCLGTIAIAFLHKYLSGRKL